MNFLDILMVVAPVFLVIGAGQLASRSGLLSDSVIDGLMRFANFVGFPLLLFGAISRLDLGAVFDPALLATYYLSAFTCFILGLLGARVVFRRDWPDAVVIGFGCLFANAVLLGIPISERALGADALGSNFAIISIHAPFCYVVGVTAMELALAQGKSARETAASIAGSMSRNPLVIALTAGFVVNFSGVSLPDLVWEPIDMIARAALPTALVALGGVLTRYSFGRSVGAAVMVSAITLGLRPAMVYGLGHEVFALGDGAMNSALMTAAMAPGVNMYVFASLYNRAQGAAASTLILSTSLSVLTVSAWMMLLAH